MDDNTCQGFPIHTNLPGQDAKIVMLTKTTQPGMYPGLVTASVGLAWQAAKHRPAAVLKSRKDTALTAADSTALVKR